ncbi:unnamed protein product, partial [Rotaria sp. Silwood2]
MSEVEVCYVTIPTSRASFGWNGLTYIGNKKLEEFWHRLLLTMSSKLHIYVLDTSITEANIIYPLIFSPNKTLKSHQQIYYYITKDVLFDHLKNYWSTHVIVFLDPELKINQSDMSLLPLSMEYFSRCDLCFDHISSLKHQSLVILVVVSSFASVFDRIYSDKYALFIPQLTSIIIFDACCTSKHDDFERQELLYFINEVEFVKQIQRDTAGSFEPTELFFFDNKTRQMSLRSSRKDQFQLLTDLVVSIAPTVEEKDEMMGECFLSCYQIKDKAEVYGNQCPYCFDDILQIPPLVDTSDDTLIMTPSTSLPFFAPSCFKPNENKLKDVKEFYERYNKDQAIFWYTRDSFLFRLLNEACRTEDIDKIYVFRYYIRDLYQQLSILHKDYVQYLKQNETNVITLYRGQKISNEELQELQNNIGKSYSTNTFLSTTTNIEVAYMFAGIDIDPVPNSPEENVLGKLQSRKKEHLDNSYDQSLSEEKSCAMRPKPSTDSVVLPYDSVASTQSDIRCKCKSVMFSYIININILTKPYADISKESNHEIEDEVLLSMGTIFRCESVEYLINGDFWHVKMIMIDDDNDNDVDHDSKRQILNDIQQKPILLMLGKFVLETSHNSDKAERYYRMFLESEIMSPWDKCEAYVALGLMCKNKGQYEIAIEYFETIIDICKIHSIENEHMNREYMTLSYVNIAEIYTITDFQKAIKTLNTIIELHLYSPIELAKVYNMLGDIYRTRTTLCKIALKYYRLAHANDSKNQKYIQNIELIRQEINRP